ncbi:MAG: tRNA (N6-isopentenyl adenosine(37)-C2)-methylthiotransferase MiaB [Candidatus Brocadiia bacterium]
MPRTYHITTFGCQMNKLDSELIEGALRRHGYEPADEPDRANVVLYNTCSVRDQAENRVFSHLGTFRERANDDPDFILGVVGCMAQRLGEELREKFPYIRLVCGTRNFTRIPDYLEHLRATEDCIVAIDGDDVDIRRDPELRNAGPHGYVSIMRGCDNYCAYCVVPHLRGRETSRPPQQVLEEVRRLVDSGIREVTLLGQNVNSYGKGLEEGVNLPALLRQLNDVDGLRRIRFITSHPKDMNEQIFRAVSGLDAVCEHVHMPAQSGSDSVLERMNRGYDSGRYYELIEKGREICPDLAFASDFIVGFPGETEEDFERTVELVRTVEFQQSYIFRYSPRPGTRAAEMNDDVPDGEKRRRQQVLLEAQKEVDGQRRAALRGQVLPVLCTEKNASHPEEGKWRGRTRQNDIAVFSAPACGIGDIRPVRIQKATELTLFGEAVRREKAQKVEV